MDLWRTALDPWGRKVLVGISWNLMWAVIVLSVVFVAAHAVWARVRGVAAAAAEEAGGAVSGAESGLARSVPERVLRHGASARAFHWIMALVMFALLFTAFLPGVGIRFAWVAPHWIAGVLLLLVVAYHAVHATVWQDWRSMWIGRRDVREGAAELRRAFSRSAPAPPRSGKYPVDHKVYHHVTALVSLAAIATGLLMMVRVKTPFRVRNPYLLSDEAWGIVYVVHGLSGVALIALVAAHVYFAVRPEKRWMTWAMIRGWIRREEYLAHHDPALWVPEPEGGLAPGPAVEPVMLSDSGTDE